MNCPHQPNRKDSCNKHCRYWKPGDKCRYYKHLVTCPHCGMRFRDRAHLESHYLWIANDPKQAETTVTETEDAILISVTIPKIPKKAAANRQSK